ncbi:MAG: DUF4011 domain-containing protein, partial [Tissierellia bacterium]|nr:DUF4011 domain-containing protein [Tissierellia bacterium]
YAAIYEQNINYSTSPPTYEFGQRVRLPHDVLKGKIGNCIEMAVLFSSLCEAFNIHSFIVMIKGHAFVGAWLTDNIFEENAVRDISELRKRLVDGINDIEILEATYLNAGSGKSFEKAVRRARDLIEDDDEFECIVDIYRSHRTGIRPMPIKIYEEGEAKIIDFGLADDADSTAKVAKTIEEHFLDTSKLDEVDKRTIWMRNLLDLSKRNSLLSFRNGAKTIQIFASNLSLLEDTLSKGESFTLREVSNEWDVKNKKIDFADIESREELIEKISTLEFKSRRLRTFLSPEELSKTAKTIYREAKKAIEETGSNTLYLAMGFLRWWDPTDPKDADGMVPLRYAPLVLIPVDLTRSAKGTYQITLRDEDAQMNITLLEMLRQNFDMKIGNLTSLPMDEYGVDLSLVFNSMRKAVMEKKGWDVVEMACIGLFSFSQFVMWNDLRTRFEQLTKNKVVKALDEGLYLDHPSEDFSADNIDSHTSVADVVIPSSVDSSQLAAIIEATKGTSFVLHGPPGTGKSQTITNMIANAIYQQKTVIFVAEKMAALDVVKERLTDIGLGDYCLELHSNKTQKKVLLDKFEKSLSLIPMEDDQSFAQKAEEIQRVKNSLNTIIDGIHKTHNHGYCVYDLIGEYTKQGKVQSVFDFTNDQLASLTPVMLNRWESLIRELEWSLKQLDVPYYIHPLKDWKKDGYTLRADEQVGDALSNIKRLSESLTKMFEKFGENNDGILDLLNQPNMLSLLESMLGTIEKRNIKTQLDEEKFSLLFDEDLLKDMENIVNLAKEYSPQRDNLLKRYGASIESYDYVQGKKDFIEATNTFVLFKSKNQRTALQDINSHTRDGFEVDANNAIAEFDAIATNRELKDSIQKDIDKVIKMLDIKTQVVPEDIDSIEDLYVLAKLVTGIRKENKYSLKDMYSVYKIIQDNQYEEPNPVILLLANHKELDERLDFLSQMTGVDINELKSSDRWIDTLDKKVLDWQVNLEKWKSWSAFYHSIETLKNESLDNIVDGLWNANLDSDGDLVLRTYKSNLSRNLIQYHLEQTKELSRFNGMSFEGQIAEYNRLIDTFEKISQNQIRIKLSQNLPNNKNTTKEEQKQIANLTRGIRSKGRGASIRSIFQDSGLVIRRMTPVLLMSPISVAQYIDPSLPPFDLVIFDEASQIRTSNAIGAMSRAKDCIIVGDPNQMPPTNFFSSQTLDEDNLHIEALESLLEDCLAVNMPQRFLNWHYRSQSESLITFSNQMYYGGKMKTFPSPFDRLSKVKFFNVKGIYDRGSTRTNKVEAQAIIEDIKRRLQDPELVKDSIGVVTFNIQQQNLIDDLLQEELRKDSNLVKIVEGLEEPIFIKNLENVQGDERDVIIFSIGFGHDQDGKMSLNFGPLNRKGGWRRLNVAVSRARKEMSIYASIEPHDIKIRETSPDGIVGIRRFMEFAQKGYFTETGNQIADKMSQEEILITEIANFLKANGYNADTYVGTSGIRMDIAVIDPKNPRYYLTAIRLDGKQYAGSKTARDRNRLMPDVFKSRGWNVYSLWTLDWYDNQNREQQKLLAYLDELSKTSRPIEEASQEIEEDIPEIVEFEEKQDEVIEEKTAEKPAEIPDESIVQKAAEKILEAPKESFVKPIETQTIQDMNKFDAKISIENSKPEQIADIPEKTIIDRPTKMYYEKYIHPQNYESSTLYDDPKLVTAMIQQIINIEAPICSEEIYYRVLESFGGMRLTKKSTEFLQTCL